MGLAPSPRARRLLVAPVLAAMLVALLVPYGALAVHDTGAFELEGNAVSDTSGPPDDWDRVCNQVTAGAQCASAGPTQAYGGATAVGWTAEPSPNSSIFTGGGSKDPIDINQWAWKDESGGLPDKDNLTHAFSARYSLTPSATCPSTGTTCEVLYFGSDRFDNSGDAQQGFWFLQNAIGLGSNKVGGGTGFSCQGSTCASGFHRTGDVLVISDFSNGGNVATMTIYKWNPGLCPTGKEAGCGDVNLEKLASSDQAKCGDSANPSPDRGCGIVNSSNGTTAPWSFLDKSGNTTYLQGELFEGGINLSSFNLGNECFSSVIAETRSSTSTTAVLKDFVVTPFAVCGASLRTQTSATSIPIGSSLTDSATVTVSGGTNPPAPTGTVSFFACGPAATTCATTGTAFNTQPLSGAVKVGNEYTVTSASFTPNAAGTWCFAASWPGDSNYAQAGGFRDNGANECFTVTPRQPTISTSQTVGPVLIGTPISDTATLGNTAPKPNGDPAGGTIVFTVYGPRANPATAVCTTATLVFTSSGFAVSGNGTYGPATFTPTATGIYDWIATYSGDPPNTLGVASGCGDEASAIAPKQPTITTSQTAGPVPLGTAITDTATLGNTAPKPNGSPAGGTIVFTVYGPRADASTPVCTAATLVFTSSGFAVSGDGTYGPASYTPTAAGTYDWIATYSGDPPNTLGVASLCGDEASVIIQLQPTMTTAQRFRPNDSATVTVTSGAGNLAGTIRFQLFVNDSGCAGTAVYDSGEIDITTGTGTGLSRTVSTSNTTEYVTTGTTFSWLVTYTSTNSGQKNVTATCNAENSSITIDNGGTFNTP